MIPIFFIYSSSKQLIYQLLQLFIKLRIVAFHTMPHACNDLVVICNNVTQCLNIFHINDCTHPLFHISCKLHLMIIYMLVKLVLARHNNWCLTNL